MSQDMQEEWRPIDGYPNYQVSNRGRVKNIKSGRMLKPVVINTGYECVNLSKNGKYKTYRLHRLVAQAFIPNPLNLAQVNHIDENKANNDVTNLEWCTVSQNNKHSAHQQSCRINQLSLDGEFIREWKSSKEIERELGYFSGHIIKCCKGKIKKVYDYRWKYTDASQQRKFNRPVVALTKDGEFVAEYKSVAEASRCLNIYVNCIHLCLKGITNTTHGLKFKYADEQ